MDQQVLSSVTTSWKMAERTLPKQDATTNWHPKALQKPSLKKRTWRKKFQVKMPQKKFLPTTLEAWDNRNSL